MNEWVGSKLLMTFQTIMIYTYRQKEKNSKMFMLISEQLVIQEIIIETLYANVSNPIRF